MKNKQPVSYLKLPYLFDAKKLEKEVNSILPGKWTPHFNQGGYKGNWNSIALYAPDGDESRILAVHHQPEILEKTNALKKCTYLQEVLDHFKCEFLSVRLLKLHAGAYIKPHRDYNLGYEDGCFRLHIPIITHADIEFMLNGNLLKMAPGSCWYTNVNYVHSVANKSSKDRIHLVIDGARNEWSDQLFFALAPEENLLLKQEEIYSPETKQRILEELKRMNTPASQLLINKLSRE